MPRATASESPPAHTVAVGLKLWATYSNQALEGILGFARRHPGYVFRDLLWTEAEQLPELLRRARPAGAILSLAAVEYSAICDQIAADSPLVSIGADTLDDRVGIVCSDDRAMMTLAVKHLSSVGYRRIGFVGWDDSAGSARREAVLRRQCRSAAVFNVRLQAPTEDLDGATLKALQKWLVAQRRPVGVIAWSGSIAAHVLFACQRAGLAVPKDVGILSLSDDHPCLCSEPTISAIDVNGEELGWRAMNMLAAMMRGKPAPRAPVMVAPTAVIARQSTNIAPQECDTVDTALQFIEQNALRGIVIKNVLAILPGVGRSQFYADFSERIGCSPGDYIRSLKIKRAKELLSGTELSVTRIATMSGFGGPTQFGVTFKREVGLTPLAFRQDARGQMAASTSLRM